MKTLKEIEQYIEELGIEDEVCLFKDFDYASAFVGVSIDNKAVYDYDLMVSYLIEHQQFEVQEALEWIDYNTVRSLAYLGDNHPIIIIQK